MTYANEGGSDVKLIFKWTQNFAYMFFVVLCSFAVVGVSMIWWMFSSLLSLDDI